VPETIGLPLSIVVLENNKMLRRSVPRPLEGVGTLVSLHVGRLRRLNPVSALGAYG